MRTTRTVLVAVLAAGGIACSDSTSVELRGNVAVSFATRNPAAVPSLPLPRPAILALDDTLTSGADTLIVTRAQIVLREIELEPVETASCDAEPKPMGCREIELGPVLVDLPLAAGAVRRFAVEVPPNLYDEIEFKIHKVSGDDPEDAAFRQAHPEFVDKSIRVEGTFNGQEFVFESDLNVDQELDLSPPLAVDETTSTNVTIRVGLATWFRSETGALIDPATANEGGENKSVVEENIKRSIEAFEDEDEDGDHRD